MSTVAVDAANGVDEHIKCVVDQVLYPSSGNRKNGWLGRAFFDDAGITILPFAAVNVAIAYPAYLETSVALASAIGGLSGGGMEFARQWLKGVGERGRADDVYQSVDKALGSGKSAVEQSHALREMRKLWATEGWERVEISYEEVTHVTTRTDSKGQAGVHTPYGFFAFIGGIDESKAAQLERRIGQRVSENAIAVRWSPLKTVLQLRQEPFTCPKGLISFLANEGCDETREVEMWTNIRQTLSRARFKAILAALTEQETEKGADTALAVIDKLRARYGVRLKWWGIVGLISIPAAVACIAWWRDIAPQNEEQAVLLMAIFIPCSVLATVQWLRAFAAVIQMRRLRPERGIRRNQRGQD
jgi:hypothetical protein